MSGNENPFISVIDNEICNNPVGTGTERFYPAERALHDEPTVTRESIHHIKLLNDGTIVILYHLRGDLDRAEAVLNACPTVLRCDIAGQGEGLGWNHSMAVDPAKSLLELLHESEVVVDTPLRYTSEGAVRVTVIGEETPLQRALGAISELVDVHLEKTGEYRPEFRHLVSMLTDRQREILTIAVEHGYYEVPRRATYSDIAAEVGINQATVGEHLQKIEAKILSRAIRGSCR